MVRTAVAFCPGHISGYFRRVEGTDPQSTGSLGAGLVISEGVRTRVSSSRKTEVTVRVGGATAGMASEFSGSAPIEYAMKRLGCRAQVETFCHLPPGAGFGMSAAALLSSITALNALFGLGMDRRKIAACAHESEVVHHSGLGDVAACQGGGMVWRNAAGIDAPITRTFFRPDEPVYAITFGPLPTSEVLSREETMKQIKKAYPKKKPEGRNDFMVFSRDFAEKSGLITPRVRTVLSACDAAGVPASMTMLGEGVFSFGNAAERILSRFGHARRMHIARTGFDLEGIYG